MLVETDDFYTICGEFSISKECCRVLIHPYFNTNVMCFTIITELDINNNFLLNMISSSI